MAGLRQDQGGDLGTHVYMTRLFDLDELLADVRAILRRQGRTRKTVLSPGSVSLGGQTLALSSDRNMLYCAVGSRIYHAGVP